MRQIQNNTAQVLTQGLEGLISVGRGEWPQPEPISEEVVSTTEYPVNALGATIAGAVKAVSEVVTIQPAVAAQAFLSAANLAVQHLANIEVPGIQPQPVSLYFMTVAASGDRKTAADSWALRGLRHIQREQYARFQDASKAHKEALKNGEELPGTEPVSPLFITTDFTSEGLARDLQRGFPAVGLFCNEGGVITGGYGMNADNRTKTAGALNGFWDGADVRITRKSDEPILLSGRRVCMHIAMQPRVAASFYADDGLKDQGLLARFLVAFPPEREAAVYEENDLSNDPALLTFEARVAQIPRPTAETANSQGLQFSKLTLTREALGSWKCFHDETERKRCTEYDTIKDFAAKAPSHVLRLAATLALFDNPQTSRLEQSHIERAIALMDYYMNESLRLASPRMSEAETNARKLVDFLRGKGMTEITSAQIGNLSPLRRKALWQPAVALLVAKHYLRVKQQDVPNTWEINPAIWTA